MTSVNHLILESLGDPEAVALPADRLVTLTVNDVLALTNSSSVGSKEIRSLRCRDGLSPTPDSGLHTRNAKTHGANLMSGALSSPSVCRFITKAVDSVSPLGIETLQELAGLPGPHQKSARELCANVNASDVGSASYSWVVSSLNSFFRWVKEYSVESEGFTTLFLGPKYIGSVHRVINNQYVTIQGGVVDNCRLVIEKRELDAFERQTIDRIVYGGSKKGLKPISFPELIALADMLNRRAIEKKHTPIIKELIADEFKLGGKNEFSGGKREKHLVQASLSTTMAVEAFTHFKARHLHSPSLPGIIQEAEPSVKITSRLIYFDPSGYEEIEVETEISDPLTPTAVGAAIRRKRLLENTPIVSLAARLDLVRDQIEIIRARLRSIVENSGEDSFNLSQSTINEIYDYIGKVPHPYRHIPELIKQSVSSGHIDILDLLWIIGSIGYAFTYKGNMKALDMLTLEVPMDMAYSNQYFLAHNILHDHDRKVFPTTATIRSLVIKEGSSTVQLYAGERKKRVLIAEFDVLYSGSTYDPRLLRELVYRVAQRNDFLIKRPFTEGDMSIEEFEQLVEKASKLAVSHLSEGGTDHRIEAERIEAARSYLQSRGIDPDRATRLYNVGCTLGAEDIRQLGISGNLITLREQRLLSGLSTGSIWKEYLLLRAGLITIPFVSLDFALFPHQGESQRRIAGIMTRSTHATGPSGKHIAIVPPKYKEFPGSYGIVIGDPIGAAQKGCFVLVEGGVFDAISMAELLSLSGISGCVVSTSGLHHLEDLAKKIKDYYGDQVIIVEALDLDESGRKTATTLHPLGVGSFWDVVHQDIDEFTRRYGLPIKDVNDILRLNVTYQRHLNGKILEYVVSRMKSSTRLRPQL